MTRLVLTPVKRIPIVNPGDNLCDLILRGLYASKIKLKQNDILVVTQKIVSKSEARFVNLAEVRPSAGAKDLAKETVKDARFIELVLRESKEILRKRPGTLIVEHKLGFVCANAGIDHSNVQNLGGKAEEWVLLLPENPDRSAKELRAAIQESVGMRIGILIIDTHGRAWRNGTMGAAIGLSGIPGVVDLRGKPDLFGYQLQVTQVAAADELAASASLVMGQTAENIPVVHVRGFPYELRESSLKELLRSRELDLFR